MCDLHYITSHVYIHVQVQNTIDSICLMSWCESVITLHLRKAGLNNRCLSVCLSVAKNVFSLLRSWRWVRPPFTDGTFLACHLTTRCGSREMTWMDLSLEETRYTCIVLYSGALHMLYLLLSYNYIPLHITYLHTSCASVGHLPGLIYLTMVLKFLIYRIFFFFCITGVKSLNC